MPPRGPLDAVPERGRGERARLVDEMLVAIDAVVDVVEPRRERLADALAVEAVAASVGHA